MSHHNKGGSMNEGDQKAWEQGIAAMGDFVSDEEKAKLAVMFAAGRGNQGVTDDEIEELISWARGVCIAHGMLESIISGAAEVVDIKDGEPAIRLTKAGLKAGREIGERMGLPVDDA